MRNMTQVFPTKSQNISPVPNRRVYARRLTSEFDGVGIGKISRTSQRKGGNRTEETYCHDSDHHFK